MISENRRIGDVLEQASPVRSCRASTTSHIRQARCPLAKPRAAAQPGTGAGHRPLSIQRQVPSASIDTSTDRRALWKCFPHPAFPQRHSDRIPQVSSCAVRFPQVSSSSCAARHRGRPPAIEHPATGAVTPSTKFSSAGTNI
eukprot:SAG31_NODE_339_length_17487_cov_20.764435_20_plen_142_part_00